MDDLKKDFDTNEMFNLLFRLITMEEAVEQTKPDKYSRLFLYLILIKEELE